MWREHLFTFKLLQIPRLSLHLNHFSRPAQCMAWRCPVQLVSYPVPPSAWHTTVNVCLENSMFSPSPLLPLLFPLDSFHAFFFVPTYLHRIFSNKNTLYRTSLLEFSTYWLAFLRGGSLYCADTECRSAVWFVKGSNGKGPWFNVGV
jgi:hypothetical protein